MVRLVMGGEKQRCIDGNPVFSFSSQSYKYDICRSEDARVEERGRIIIVIGRYD